ncbi:MAG: exodeoxyribonuclease VII large subunit [Elusimicrobia bacterium]|nr:exodeoxyribonuclease VII large subunit [Elusimicrobiota bacterium]
MKTNKQTLYELLVSWRDGRAEKENISYDKRYFILPNRTLNNIIDANPQSITDLAKVKGIGAKKLAHYGNEIIGILRKVAPKPADTVITDPLRPRSEASDDLFSNNKPETGISKDYPQILTVSQLNNQIKHILNSSFRAGIWVCGEVYRYDLDVKKAVVRPSGQVYFELVEQDNVTKERKAAISAMIWGSDRIKIDYKMESAVSGLALKDGLQIKAKCVVDFYPPQGRIQLRITDIEPEYTIGKMALEKKLLLEKLKKTGLLEKNKKLEVPATPLKVGLITSIGTAAYNDFIDELRKSGYAFSVFVCDARMQGSDLESEVCSAIYTLNRHYVDIIAIVRGGGSASDLMGFDKEKVVVAIANSKIPVLTGIGHQIDRTVADEVSNQSFKTPTATAQFVVEKIRNFELESEDIFRTIIERQNIILENEKDSLKNISREVRSATVLFTKNLENSILQTGEKIIWNLKKLFEDGFKRLDELERLSNSKNPGNILRLGFGLVYGSNNKIIKSVKDVSVNTNIKIELRDGKLAGRVTSKET